MMFACFVSEKNNSSFSSLKIKSLLNQYFLPTSFSFDVEMVMQKITHDKKMNSNFIDFIVLEKLGRANIQKLSFENRRSLLIEFLDAKND